MVKISDVELPVVLKHKLLFKSGNWNRWNITSDEIKKAYELTNWDSQRTKAMYYQHKDNDSTFWTGNVTNQTLENSVNGDTKVYGDIEIWDPVTAIKLQEGKAPFAVSAKINWSSQYPNPTNFKFANFSYVTEPGVNVPEMFINFSKDGSDNEADFIIKEDNSNLMSNERGFENSRNTMEEKVENSTEKNEDTQSAKFSNDEIEALFARVSKLEEQVSQFEAVFSEKESEKVEEKEDIKQTESKEEVSSNVEVSENKESKEDASVLTDEVKTEVNYEESKTEDKDSEDKKSEDESKAEFSDEILEELKKIRSAIGISAVPSNTASFSDTKVGFTAAINRMKKEFN